MRLTRSIAVLVLATAACGNGGVDCSGIECGAAPPALVLTVADARGGALSAAVTITNLVVPPAVHAAAHSCSPPGAGPVTCSIDADEAGHYELDVGAVGYSTQHLAVEVATAVTGRGCCEIPYVPARVDVLLSPSGAVASQGESTVSP